MIELDVRMPLARFPLSVSARLEGPAVALLGPSGSGKTSLLEAIAGLRRAEGLIAIDGEVFLDGRRALAPERRRVGWVPQHASLFPHLDVAANVAFGIRRGDRDAASRMDDAIEVLELGALRRRMPATLSGGERQRVALARALAIGPRLLLLDEPLASIDVEHRARIVPWLLRARERWAIPMIYVTHHLGEATALARDAMVLREGRVTVAGPIDRALESFGELSLENLLTGTVAPGEDHDVLDLGGATLAVPRGEAGPATFALAAEEIVIATAAPTGVSTRNVLRGRVSRIRPIGRDAIVEVDAASRILSAKVTLRASTELGLEPGREVFLLVKTHALRRLA